MGDEALNVKSAATLRELLLTLMWGFVLVPPGSGGLPPDYWIINLLTFSILILMWLEREFGWFETIAALVFSFSLCVPTGSFAAMLACPWLLVRLRHAFSAVCERQNPCLACSRIFPAIGAAWLVAHRANWTPWGFDPLIMLLTAAHFHHAGFTLPLVAGLNEQSQPNWLTKSSCIAILAGVPLVAAGITCTHFGVMKFVEPVGVAIYGARSLGRGDFADSAWFGKGSSWGDTRWICRFGCFAARRDAFGVRFRPAVCVSKSSADDAADVDDSRHAERVWIRPVRDFGVAWDESMKRLLQAVRLLQSPSP